MREILFRGKRTDNGDWVEGYIVIADERYFIAQYPECITSLYYPDDIYSFTSFVEVLPETVGQYTGLTDKKGTKIFEGDILHTNNSNCTLWYVDDKNTGFCCNQGNANYSCVLDRFIVFSEVEVIGNIHDNPELIEK